MFERGEVVAALADEVAALEEVLLGLSEADVVKQTRCVPWDVAALSVHTVGSLHQVSVALDGGPADPAAALVSAAGYYSPRVRLSPEVDRARVDGALERAERRSDAAEPGRVLGGIQAKLWPRLARVPKDRTLVTRHGDSMSVTEYLVTRVVESLLHGLDIADALGREPWAGDRALDLVGEVLFGGADPEALERILPGARGANALDAVRVVTGRAPARVGRVVLAGAGVRVLALG